MTTMSVLGECLFWYRLTRVVPDKFHTAVKRLCVVCVLEVDSIFSVDPVINVLLSVQLVH